MSNVPDVDSPIGETDTYYDQVNAAVASRVAELAADLAEAELQAISFRMSGGQRNGLTRRAKSFVLRHPRLKRFALRVRGIAS